MFHPVPRYKREMHLKFFPGLCSFGLILSLCFAAGASSQSECAQILKAPIAISFPSELRLSPEKINVLLKTPFFAPMITEMGALFHRLETQPEILNRLPHALNGMAGRPNKVAMLPPTLRRTFAAMPLEVQRKFARRYLQMQGSYGDGLLDDVEIAWLSFLVSGLDVVAPLAPEFDADHEASGRAKLAYLNKTLALRPQHRAIFEAMMKPRGMRELLGEDFNELLIRMISQGYTLEESTYIGTYREIVQSVEDWERLREDGIRFRDLSTTEKQELRFSNMRGIISFLMVAPAVAGQVQRDVLKEEVEYIVEENRARVLSFFEDIYFGSDFQKFDHDAFMDIFDLLVYGTPLPYTRPQILNSMLDLAGRALLPAKNYVSLEKAKSSQEKIEQKREELNQKLRLLPFQVNMKLSEPQPASVSKKRRMNSTSPAKSSLSTRAAPESDSNSARQILNFTKFAEYRRPLDQLNAETLYEFVFLRDVNKTPQRLKVSPQALAEMHSYELEAYQALDGLVTGFTSRNNPGAGVKRIYQRQNLSFDLYEARPNRGQFRMILTKHHGVWTIQSFIRKVAFLQELERIRIR